MASQPVLSSVESAPKSLSGRLICTFCKAVCKPKDFADKSVLTAHILKKHFLSVKDELVRKVHKSASEADQSQLSKHKPASEADQGQLSRHKPEIGADQGQLNRRATSLSTNLSLTQQNAGSLSSSLSCTENEEPVVSSSNIAVNVNSRVLNTTGSFNAPLSVFSHEKVTSSQESEFPAVQPNAADKSTPDAGFAVKSTPDTRLAYRSTPDAGHADKSTPNAGHANESTPDVGHANESTQDAELPDESTPDAGLADKSTPDAGHADKSTPDESTAEVESNKGKFPWKKSNANGKFIQFMRKQFDSTSEAKSSHFLKSTNSLHDWESENAQLKTRKRKATPFKRQSVTASVGKLAAQAMTCSTMPDGTQNSSHDIDVKIKQENNTDAEAYGGGFWENNENQLNDTNENSAFSDDEDSSQDYVRHVKQENSASDTEAEHTTTCDEACDEAPKNKGKSRLNSHRNAGASSGSVHGNDATVVTIQQTVFPAVTAVDAETTKPELDSDFKLDVPTFDDTSQVSTRSSRPRYTCLFCSKTFATKKTLQRHMDDKHLNDGAAVEQCTECGLTLHGANDIKDHLLAHSGAVQKDYKCEHCVESFTDVTSLRIHCESLHSNSDPCSSSNIPLEGTDSPEKRMTLNRQKKKFECHVCKKTYSKQSYFEQHMERHEIMPADEKQFICDTCQKHCTSMWQLQRHIERKHSERDDTKSSKLRRSLKAERAKHPEYDVEANSDGVYPCVLCPDKTFKLRRSRNDHLDLVHFKLRVLEPSHPCPVCGKLFMSRSEVRAHVTKHTREKKFSCDRCGMSFLRSRYLHRHVRSTHSDVTIIYCDCCGKAFKHKDALRRHLKMMAAENQETKQCEICNESFADNESFSTHRATAHPVPCPTCAKTFYSRHRMNMHFRRVHEKDKNVKCSFCGFSFLYPALLKQHLCKNPNAPIPATARRCATCGKLFANDRAVTLHMKTHETNRERSFSCEHCERTFMSDACVRRHILYMQVHRGTHYGRNIQGSDNYFAL